jgi:hypothetical protein
LLHVGFVYELTDYEAENSGLDVYWRPNFFVFGRSTSKPRLDFFCKKWYNNIKIRERNKQNFYSTYQK